MKKGRFWFGAMLCAGVCVIRASLCFAGESMSVEQTGVVSEPDKADTLFEEEIEKDGLIFHLKSVEAEILRKIPLEDQKTETVELQFPLYDENGELYKVTDSSAGEDGYRLLDVNTEEIFAEEETVLLTKEKIFSPHEQVPDILEYEYKSPMTGKASLVEIPLKSKEEQDETWVEGKNIELIFNLYDAKTYKLNGKTYENTGNPDISGNESYVIRSAGLDPEKVRVLFTAWDGEPYTVNGKLCRKAILANQRLESSTLATYEGMISVPAGEGAVQKATFEHTVTETNGEYEYEVRATGIYESVEESDAKGNMGSENEAGDKKDAFIKLIGAGVFIILLVGLVILLLLKKKKSDSYYGRKFR